MENDLIDGVNVEPRPYQLRIAAKALRMFDGQYVDNKGHAHRAAHSVLIESPTGSGKTVVGLSIARRIQQQWNFRVGWVAMRRNLLVQADRENRHRRFGVDMHLISMFDKNPPYRPFFRTLRTGLLMTLPALVLLMLPRAAS